MANHTRVRSFMRNINVLNVLLAAVLIALASYILPPLLQLKASYTVPPAKKMTAEKEEPPAVAQSPSAMEYTIIAEQNVFNPERKIPVEKKTEEKPLPKPEFVLYGTLISGDTSLAFIEDLKAPYTTASRGKRQRTLRQGESLSGFTLSEIYPDRIVMVRGDERMELRVIDASRAKTRETGSVTARKQAPAGSGPAARQQPGTAPGVVGGSQAAPLQRQQIKPRSAPRFEKATPQSATPGG